MRQFGRAALELLGGLEHGDDRRAVIEKVRSGGIAHSERRTPVLAEHDTGAGAHAHVLQGLRVVARDDVHVFPLHRAAHHILALRRACGGVHRAE